jgi:hypothetical protein
MKLKEREDNKIIADMEAYSGCPLPPPHIIKQNAIKEYQEKYGYTTLIETGTYLGNMVEAQKTRFKKIISIELGVELYEKAKERFKKDQNITLMQGDSGKVLPLIIKDLNEPAIFWLDGHYSSGITAKGDKICPIFEELDSIFNNKPLNHVLLIDDARLFVDEDDYPTIEKLTKYVKNKNNNYQVEVKDDIIRFTM